MKYSIPLHIVKLLFVCIVKAVTALHLRLNVAHCDLKPPNILISKTMVPKLADFGLSVQGGKAMTDRGTKGYSAPEVFNSKKTLPQGIDYYKADCWSLGVILYELIYRRLPFNIDSDLKQPLDFPLPL